MGNICVTGSSAAHSNYSSASSSPQHQSSSFTSQSGHEIRSADILPAADRKRFFRNHDPINYFNLNKNTKLYRTSERQYIENGTLRGHYGSGTLINDHDRAIPNPLRAEYPEAMSHRPVSTNAGSLNVPTLNVLAGANAKASALRYSDGSRALAEMRLGDVLSQGGQFMKIRELQPMGMVLRR